MLIVGKLGESQIDTSHTPEERIVNALREDQSVQDHVCA